MERELAGLVKDWVHQAGDYIRQHMQADLKVTSKSSRTDLVTELDQWTEKFLRTKISQAYPDHAVMGEEAMGTNPTSMAGPVWIIDPIDGTANFVSQQENFVIMLAFYQDGQGRFAAIYDPIRDRYLEAIKGQGVYLNDQPLKLRFADRQLDQGLVACNGHMALKNQLNIQAILDQSMGVRMYGSAGIEIMSLVKGATIAYISPRLKPWDIAAGAVICQELGLVCRQFDGQEIDLMTTNPTIFAYPSVYQKIRQHLDHELAKQ
ncbi:hypothetical protein AWM75_02900 [Aerococcus urinaehominis]|uniref:Uncharacterized protein n=1 Tax=Aerococcus urinaehominis TaxID=128944 RepID=A0A109RGK0_9LACT|nr:inositol monophosphatase family protein [Aerococcus urinaehominis]AMB99008.1 hypothetical protein AWM75_02900 [Aerococcus urinaehominis]SDM57224.1 myo-inositol-1(or 4)-monophosphatase [Aerococcus urinaehominis]